MLLAGRGNRALLLVPAPGRFSGWLGSRRPCSEDISTTRAGYGQGLSGAHAGLVRGFLPWSNVSMFTSFRFHPCRCGERSFFAHKRDGKRKKVIVCQGSLSRGRRIRAARDQNWSVPIGKSCTRSAAGNPSSFCLADAGCDFDGLVVGMSLMGAEQFRSVAGGGAQSSRFLAGGVYARAGLFSRKLIA